jgi:5-methylcytosine-specific restriction protein A
MPTLPRNLCETLQCQQPTVVGSAFCEQHKRKPRNKAASKEGMRMYNTQTWRSLRAAQLSRQPLCGSCMGRGMVTMAIVVDHVFPWRQISDDAFRESELQSLCWDCHSMKTGLEQKGIFRRWANDGSYVDFSINDWGK